MVQPLVALAPPLVGIVVQVVQEYFRVVQAVANVVQEQSRTSSKWFSPWPPLEHRCGRCRCARGSKDSSGLGQRGSTVGRRWNTAVSAAVQE
eukprot:778559-Pyramimonas_sp.AAC.1